MQELGGRKSFSNEEKEAINDLSARISIEDIDKFKRVASIQDLAELRSKTRELTTSYFNQQDHLEASNHDAALQEKINKTTLKKVFSKNSIQSQIRKQKQVFIRVWKFRVRN